MSLVMLISSAMLIAFLAWVLASIPALIVLHVLMPRAVLDQYWKEPHFRPFELGLFSGSLFAPIRTVMLMGAIAFPNLGKKRGISQARLLAPGWYRFCAKAFTVGTMVMTPLLFLSLIGFNLDAWMTREDPPWADTFWLLLTFGCFGGVGLYQWNLRRREAKGAALRDQAH
jgi:MFS family permease